MSFEEAKEKQERDYRDGYEEGVEECEPYMNCWSNVKKKLPLYKECILVYLDDKTITEAVYRGEYEKDVHVFRLELTHEDTSENVTHWMPLPKPPK
jgi:hypothetical protein